MEGVIGQKRVLSTGTGIGDWVPGDTSEEMADQAVRFLVYGALELWTGKHYTADQNMSVYKLVEPILTRVGVAGLSGPPFPGSPS